MGVVRVVMVGTALVAGCGGGKSTSVATDGSMDGARKQADGRVTRDGRAMGDGGRRRDGARPADAGMDGASADATAGRDAAFMDAAADGARGDAAAGDAGRMDGSKGDAAMADGGVRDGASRTDGDTLDANAGTDGGGDAAAVVDAGPPPRRTTTGPVDATGGLDVTTVVEGGTSPYSCSIYTGAGEGTVPSGVSLGGDTGCMITGSPDGSEPPGVYGFLVVVEDDAGRTVEVPVYVEGEPCNTGAVTIDPAAAPPRTEASGSAYSWALQVSNIDAPCGDPDCSSCGWCLNTNISASPLTVAMNLDCAEEGDVCSDCDGCVSAIEMCPDVVEMNRDVDVRSHAPIRTEGPAWVTVELGLDYSGTSTSPCGDKHWECHLATLEE